MLQAGIQTSPDAPQLYLDWANMLFDSGKPAEADAVLETSSQASAKISRRRDRDW